MKTSPPPGFGVDRHYSSVSGFIRYFLRLYAFGFFDLRVTGLIPHMERLALSSSFFFFLFSLL